MDGQSAWMFMTATGIAVAALAWLSATTIAALGSPLRRRLKALADRASVGELRGATRHAPGFVWRLLEPAKEAERTSVQLKLVRAGFDAQHLGRFYFIKLCSAVALPMLALVALRLGAPHGSALGMTAMILGAVFVGSLLPDLYLARRFANRRVKLMEGLPDALDLLVTCTESGLGLNAALERVVEQMPASHPELAAELMQVNAEVRAGMDRNAALRNLSERSGLEEINGLVSLINHSTRLGTGIAGTLRIYSDDFRDRRMQRAEELAATVGTKLIFPLLLCLFPSFFVVAIGPAILSAIEALAEK